MMRCSGCGKEVPFNGVVCPHCHRDKSSDQAIQVAGVVGMLIGGTVGSWIGGLEGMIVGAIVVGLPIAIIGAASGSHSAKKPPHVSIDRYEPTVRTAPATRTAKASTTDDDPARRLARLDALKADGIITLEEYQERRAVIIAAL